MEAEDAAGAGALACGGGGGGGAAAAAVARTAGLVPADRYLFDLVHQYFTAK